jgi:hypothetical protein
MHPQDQVAPLGRGRHPALGPDVSTHGRHRSPSGGGGLSMRSRDHALASSQPHHAAIVRNSHSVPLADRRRHNEPQSLDIGRQLDR